MSERVRLRARRLADLRSELAGWSDPVAFGAGLDGSVLVAARRSEESLYEQKGKVHFPKSRLERPTEYLVIRLFEGRMRSLRFADETIPPYFVQPLADGVLIAGARCHWRPEGAEENAFTVGWDGRVRERFTLGDGLEDVRATPGGTVWASYFDEGVFGNFGWGVSGPTPIGASGLVAFDSHGTLLREFDAEAAGTDGVCDAYALNVAGEFDAWLYFYTDFPIVRWHDGAYQAWSFGEGGASALAVREERVLLFGEDARIVELGPDGTARVAEHVAVEDDRGRSLAGAQVFGVADALYFFQDGRVLVVDGW